VSRIMDAFVPNRLVSKKTVTLIVAAELLLTLFVWITGPSKLVPRPREVLQVFPDLWREGLGVAIWTSLTTNLEALVWATGISLVISYATVLGVARPISTAVAKARFLGLVGMTFLFTLVFGGGHHLKVALIAFGVSVFFLDAMSEVVGGITRDEYDYARTLRMNEWQVVYEVVILGRAATAFDILRQTAAMGWVMLTMVEGLVRSEGGLGALLLNQNKHFNLAAVFAIQITILAIGLLQDWAIGVFKNLACPYASLKLERR
jgi:NitT/TauT family transport system permease protein